MRMNTVHVHAQSANLHAFCMHAHACHMHATCMHATCMHALMHACMHEVPIYMHIAYVNAPVQNTPLPLFEDIQYIIISPTFKGKVQIFPKVVSKCRKWHISETLDFQIHTPVPTQPDPGPSQHLNTSPFPHFLEAIVIHVPQASEVNFILPFKQHKICLWEYGSFLE